VGGFYNIVLIIYLYVVHVIICNPRNSASGCNVVSILIIIIKNNIVNNEHRVAKFKICFILGQLNNKQFLQDFENFKLIN
jgi:hypothetical protein